MFGVDPVEALKKSPADFQVLMALGYAADMQNFIPMQKAMARAKKGDLTPSMIQAVYLGTRGGK